MNDNYNNTVALVPSYWSHIDLKANNRILTSLFFLSNSTTITRPA